MMWHVRLFLLEVKKVRLQTEHEIAPFCKRVYLCIDKRLEEVSGFGRIAE